MPRFPKRDTSPTSGWRCAWALAAVLGVSSLTGGAYGATHPVGQKPHDVVAADLDGDTVLDLVTADRHSDQISVLLGVGDGSFAVPSSYATGQWPTALAVADFDADGDLDVAVANNKDDSISVLTNNGAGALGSPADYLVGRRPD